jgi:NitT/TauT family transport system substrate-binding protein
VTRHLVWIGLLVSLIACRSKPTPEAAPPSAAASVRSAPPPPQKVTLALDWVPEPEFGGFYAGRELGAYAKRGIKLEVQGGGAGAPVVQQVAMGRVEFGTAGADGLLTARARGADVVAVFASFQTSPQGIMVHAARKLDKLEDVFRSGTLALETGLAYATYLKNQFSFQGVKIVPYDGGVAHFLADPSFGQQCFVTSEPIAAKKQGADPKVFLIADSGFNPYATVVVTRGELIRKNPELVRKFMAATREGWESYLANPGPTNALLHRLNGALDESTLDAAAAAERPLIEGGDAVKLGVGAMTRERWESLAKQLQALKLIEAVPRIEDVFWSGAQ